MSRHLLDPDGGGGDEEKNLEKSKLKVKNLPSLFFAQRSRSETVTDSEFNFVGGGGRIIS